MKKNALSLLALLPLLAGVAGCSITPAIHGNGVRVTEARDVSGFHAVSIGGSGQAIITQGGDESLEIATDENLLPYIHTEVRNGELRVYTKGNLRFSEGPVYTIAVRELDALRLSGALRADLGPLETGSLNISVSGSGRVQVEQLEAEELAIGVSGSGRIDVAGGQAEGVELSISGSGDLRAEDFQVKRADVSISGSGSARVWVEEAIDAHVSGSGSILYKGSPSSVHSSISGSGNVRPIE